MRRVCIYLTFQNVQSIASGLPEAPWVYSDEVSNFLISPSSRSESASRSLGSPCHKLIARISTRPKNQPFDPQHSIRWKIRTVCDLRAPCRLLWHELTGAPRGDHLSASRQTSSWGHFPRANPIPATPFQCPRSRTTTLGSVAAALTCPYVGLTVHRAVSVRRSTTAAGDPADNDPGAVFENDPHPRSSAGRLLEP